MRRALRPLILLIILLTLGVVGATYYARLKQQAQNSPAKPKKLAPGTAATFHGWTYTHTSNEQTVITVHAEDFREVEGKQELTGLELDIYHKDGNQYDRVKSAKAEFDMSQGILYSDGEVEITMGVPEDQPPSGRLMVIKSSGVRVESKTGKASTDRLATFQFDRGRGKAVGAEYDPNTRELVMHSQVELLWRGSNPKGVPMKVETGEVHYKERDAKVYLSPWSKLSRDTMTMNAGPATVSLNEGTIKLVETTQAHGTDQRPGRNLEYGANQLTIDFNDNNQITKITGVEQGRLVATADTAVTTLTSDRVTLFFETTSDNSVLNTALAEGHSVAESKPVAASGLEPADTRILKSDTINMRMRAGGQEIEYIDTPSAAAIEFIPNRSGEPHRWVNGDRVSIAYGERNQIRSFRTVNVATRTEKSKPKDAKEAPPPELTWSKDLLATFQPNSSQLAKLEQWNDFRYEAGERRAKADRALLDQANNAIELTGSSRVSDNTGSADADRIVLDQKSGDFSAEGNVSSTRLPDKKRNNAGGGGMLSEDEPLHARAKKMRSTDGNLQIRYDGNAVLWQGANRLQADAVEIDRDQNMLNAHGHVLSQLLDKAADPPKTSEGKKTATNPAARVFTVVRAPELEYNDEQRIALYKDGVELERPNMRVKAHEIRAFLRTGGNDSSLDHTFADGKVEIVQTAPSRVRNGASEHAEYYVDEDKVILEGGQPQFTDSLRGTTRGEKLTWFSKDDRLLVNGVENKPAKSVLKRKVK
jgi:lipopolysaccharide export system protein LptA